jgi:lactate dehydrogenase-like 2-hydroxyacid dehydrogenase
VHYEYLIHRYECYPRYVDADRHGEIDLTPWRDRSCITRQSLPAGHPFRTLDNVLVTPHVGYVAEDLYRTFYGNAAASISVWLDEVMENKKASPT